MTEKQAKTLVPGIYEITFHKHTNSIGAIGSDDKNKPWFAAINWTGSTSCQWQDVESVTLVIPSTRKLPK